MVVQHQGGGFLHISYVVQYRFSLTLIAVNFVNVVFFCVFFSDLCLGDCVSMTNWGFAGIFSLVCEIFWGVCAFLFFFTVSVVDLAELVVTVVSMALLRLWWCAHA